MLVLAAMLALVLAAMLVLSFQNFQVISLLVENRPKDPIAFLSQYFASLVEEVSVNLFEKYTISLLY